MGWLAIPGFARTPGTEAELARELGVAPLRARLTFLLWRLRPSFRREVARIAATLRGGDLADLFAALEREAAKGSAKHIRLYLELLDIAEKMAEQPAGTVVLVGVKYEDT
jgi:hypothetical protein